MWTCLGSNQEPLTYKISTLTVELHSFYDSVILAGGGGFEPPLTVLETVSFPLAEPPFNFLFTPGEIRTPNLLVRSQALLLH